MHVTWQQLCPYHLKELSLLATLAADESQILYIVGGCLRDVLLKRPNVDYDIASAGDPTALAKIFSRHIGGRWFSLDAQRGYSRVIKSVDKGGNTEAAQSLQIDFAPLRADSIEGDLTLRDFTINAMATLLPVDISPEDNLKLIDPLGGRNDLAAGCIRMCSTTVLADDPLRIIKGLRHCAQLGFFIEAKTLAASSQYAPLLKQVAGERIRNELAHLFAAQYHQYAVDLFLPSGIARALSIDGDDQHIAQNYLILQERIQTVLQKLSVSKYILRCAGDDFTVLSVMRFISLMRSMRSEDKNIDNVLNRLHFNKRLRKLFSFACKINVDLLNCFWRLTCSERGKLLWLQQHGAPLPDSLLVCALFTEDTIDPLALDQLFRTSLRLLHNDKIVPLLTSQQLIQQQPELVGKKMGAFLSDLAKQEILGRVHNKPDAIDYLKRWHESN